MCAEQVEPGCHLFHRNCLRLSSQKKKKTKELCKDNGCQKAVCVWEKGRISEVEQYRIS
jgi:hypothetical protein